MLRECRTCSASGSRLVASAVNRASLRRAREGGKKGGAKATWASCVDDPAGEFGTRGWDALTIAQPGERGCEYGHGRPASRRIRDRAVMSSRRVHVLFFSIAHLNKGRCVRVYM